MLDRDLAILFGVETKVLNQTVKRNLDRFPDNFRFQLTDREQIELVTFCDRFKMLKHSTSLMYAFSEVGVVMLSSVLRSQVAISVSIQIANAFLEMRRFLKDNAEVFLRIDDIEQKHLRLAFDIIYANKADMLNVALFTERWKHWRCLCKSTFPSITGCRSY